MWCCLMLMVRVRIVVEYESCWNNGNRLSRLLVTDAPEARRVCSKPYPLRTGGKKRDAFHFEINTFPDKCHNLNELPPAGTHSPMSPWCPNSRRSYLTGQIQAPSLWQWHYRCTEGRTLVKAGGTDGTAASCLVPVQYAPPSWKRVWSCAHQPDPPGESQSHKPIEKLILILLNMPQSLARLVFHDQNS